VVKDADLLSGTVGERRVGGLKTITVSAGREQELETLFG
jgi:hypothetical protein